MVPESCQVEDWGPDEIRGWKEGRDLAAARASLPVQGPEPPASVRVLPAPWGSGTGATGQLPLGNAGLVADFNALWRENWLSPVRICSPRPGAESLLKSRFCNFSQLTQESAERWPVFWFLEREEKDSVSSLYLCVIVNSKATRNSIASADG